LWGFSEKQSKEGQQKKRTSEEIPKGIETHSRGTRHRKAGRGCNRTRALVLRWNPFENQNIES
jgi:ribosomal protein S6E (S10)